MVTHRARPLPRRLVRQSRRPPAATCRRSTPRPPRRSFPVPTGLSTATLSAEPPPPPSARRPASSAAPAVQSDPTAWRRSHHFPDRRPQAVERTHLSPWVPVLLEFEWQRHPAAGPHCGWKPQSPLKLLARATPLPLEHRLHVRYMLEPGQAESEIILVSLFRLNGCAEKAGSLAIRPVLRLPRWGLPSPITSWMGQIAFRI
jgi:hypothetical protein